MQTWDRLIKLMFPALLMMMVIGTAAASWGMTIQTATGASHTITLRSDGTIWASGLNVFGQLGDGTNNSQNSPVRIGSDSNWIAVAAGADHTLALKADGSLWAWGSNLLNQVGDGSGGNRNQPVRIGSANDWTAISAGGESSFALKANGSLWAWGRNNFGQLGTGDAIGKSVPAPVLNSGLSSYVAVSTGGDHTLALQADGTLWGWGANQFGQIAQPTINLSPNPTPVVIGLDSDWKGLSAGGIHSLALKADGTLWAWGDNQLGQLGQGATDLTPHNEPIKVGTARDWAALSAGDFHSLAVKRDGTLWAWGDNSSGQLGNGSTTDQPSPLRIAAPADINNILAVAAGTTYSLATKANGEVYGWGDNGVGQLGNATTDSSFTPILVRADAINWIDTEPGGSFTVARRSDGSLWTWGDNTSGQLGDANNTFLPRLVPAMVGTATNWAANATGWSHTVALKADGTLWTWGANASGQLGDGTNSNAQAPTQITVTQPTSAADNWKAVAAGDFHTVALKADGTLWAWGDNSSGQLGDGSGLNRNLPVQVITGNPGNFDSHWIAIAAGGSHTLALQVDGTLWVWGDNSSGQLGNPAFGAGSTTPLQLANLSAPPTPGYNSSWVAIAAGLSHSLALQADGTLWAWGGNFSGQLGNGDATLPNPPDQPEPVAVVNVGSAYRAIAAGDSYSIARTANGSLWLWGNNTSGQLANGATDPDPLNPVPHPTPARETSPANDWAVVGSGGTHAAALKASGTLWTWGNNASGQLGDNSIVAKTSPTLIPTNIAPTQVTIIASAAANGLISPAGAVRLSQGANQTFTIIPDAGFTVAALVVDGTLLPGTTSHTFTNVTADHYINAYFEPSGFNVTAGADANGTISPAGVTAVTPGGNLTYTITPNAGFMVAALVVDGTQLPGATSYSFTNVAASHFINAYFAPSDLAVTAAAGPGGAISPAGITAVTPGASQTYTITPDAGFMVAALVVDGTQLPGATSHTFTNVVASHYINAYFEQSDLVVTAAAAADGSISPAGTTPVTPGGTMTYTITPNPGFQVAALVVDGTLLPGATSHTFTNVVASHYINAYFEPVATFNITAAAAANGSISPAGATVVTTGNNQTYTITPDPGFTVAALVVDGTQLAGATSYTFTNVTASHYISAYFTAIPTFAVTASAAANGSISPAGVTAVAQGADQTYTITPDPGFVVTALVVDGTQLPGATTHTFTNVTGDHYINAYFAPVSTFTITAGAGANGSISPAGVTAVTSGGSQTYNITPDAGFIVSAIVVDGSLLPGVTSYTFTNVTGDHYINAYFE